MSATRRIKIGAYEAVWLNDTPFGLDAGTMFRMVPMPVWRRKVEPDSSNRVFVGLNCLLLRGEGRTILYDAGIGNKLSDKQKSIYGLDPDVSLISSLTGNGVAPGDVDTVVLSHLHLDHAGWLTTRNPSGALVRSFPNAVYVVQKTEWQAAMAPNELTAGSYAADDYSPLENSNRLRLVEGEHEIAPGVRVRRTGGHSAGHQIMVVRSQGRTLACPCELVPDVWHLRLAWLTAYDVAPMELIEEKRALLREAAEGGWILFLSHDPQRAFIRVRPLSEKEYTWEDAMEESPAEARK